MLHKILGETIDNDGDSSSSTRVDSYRLLGSGIVLTEPGADWQNWHQDGGHLDLDRRVVDEEQARRGVSSVPHAVNIFIPLVDLTRANGPTEFIPASHLSPDDSIFRRRAPPSPDDDDAGGAGGGDDFCPGVSVAPELPAGSMAIFDYRLTHRGRPNRRSSPRLGAAPAAVRPVLYFTVAKSWFKDEVNSWGEEALLPQDNGEEGDEAYWLSSGFAGQELRLVRPPRLPHGQLYAEPHLRELRYDGEEDDCYHQMRMPRALKPLQLPVLVVAGRHDNSMDNRSIAEASLHCDTRAAKALAVELAKEEEDDDDEEEEEEEVGEERGTGGQPRVFHVTGRLFVGIDGLVVYEGGLGGGGGGKGEDQAEKAPPLRLLIPEENRHPVNALLGLGMLGGAGSTQRLEHGGAIWTGGSNSDDSSRLATSTSSWSTGAFTGLGLLRCAQERADSRLGAGEILQVSDELFHYAAAAAVVAAAAPTESSSSSSSAKAAVVGDDHAACASSCACSLARLHGSYAADLGGSLVVLPHSWSLNYFHFTVEMLPKLLAARAAIRRRGRRREQEGEEETRAARKQWTVIVPEVPFASELVRLVLGAEESERWKIASLPIDRVAVADEALVMSRPASPLSAVAVWRLRRAVLGRNGAGRRLSFGRSAGSWMTLRAGLEIARQRGALMVAGQPSAGLLEEAGGRDSASFVAVWLLRRGTTNKGPESGTAQAMRQQARTVANSEAVLATIQRVLSEEEEEKARENQNQVEPAASSAALAVGLATGLLPVAAQVAILRRTRLLVGVEGAGLTSLLYMPLVDGDGGGRGAAVVNVLPGKRQVSEYLSRCGMTYYWRMVGGLTTRVGGCVGSGNSAGGAEDKEVQRRRRPLHVLLLPEEDYFGRNLTVPVGPLEEVVRRALEVGEWRT